MFKEIIQKLKTWRKDRQQLVAVPDPEPETDDTCAALDRQAASQASNQEGGPV